MLDVSLGPGVILGVAEMGEQMIHDEPVALGKIAAAAVQHQEHPRLGQAGQNPDHLVAQAEVPVEFAVKAGLGKLPGGDEIGDLVRAFGLLHQWREQRVFMDVRDEGGQVGAELFHERLLEEAVLARFRGPVVGEFAIGDSLAGHELAGDFDHPPGQIGPGLEAVQFTHPRQYPGQIPVRQPFTHRYIIPANLPGFSPFSQLRF